ncbi:MAG: chemotaxis protein CheY [Paenibacillaceae bacterium]|jgi:chemotaxis protein CheC|nr:chemotaxis protein CheY [Paenibacillaceae bacterium]
MTEFNNFAELHMDILKEIGNIGAGHAATALSQLLDKQVDMLVPNARVIPFWEISNSVGGPEKEVIAVYLRVEGDVPGNLFFILAKESSRKLLKQLVDSRYETGEEYSDMEKSALCEIANILAGSYLSSLADFTQLHMTPTVPALSIDMAGAILSYGLLQYGQVGDLALLIDTTFFEGMEAVEGHFFLLPDPHSFEKIFRALGVPDL